MDTKLFIKEKLTEVLSENKTAAGVLIKCVETNRILLLLRNDKNPIWSLVSGGINDNEEIIDGLKREIKEELSIDPNIIKMNFIKTYEYPEKKSKFHYFEGLTNKEFSPTLDHENLKYLWCDESNLPTPLYDGLDLKIKNIWNKMKF